MLRRSRSAAANPQVGSTVAVSQSGRHTVVGAVTAPVVSRLIDRRSCSALSFEKKRGSLGSHAERGKAKNGDVGRRGAVTHSLAAANQS